MSRPFLLTAALALAFLGAARVAHATLGEQETSIDTDRHALVATEGATAVSGKFRVHELTTKNLGVKEYVSPSGVVFALSWTGKRQPDVTSLLGNYRSEYEAAVKRDGKIKGHRNFRVWKGTRLVIERFGHGRWARGRAYDPSLIPNGVTLNEIQ